MNIIIINAFVVIEMALTIYFYILIASVLLSWLPELKRSRIGQFIDRLANPYMRLFRGFLVIGMFDFTPIIGFFLYQFGLGFFSRMVDMLIAGV